MTDPITFLIAVAGLFLTALGLIAKQEDNLEIRKILAWVIFTIITLLFPSVVVIWLTMQSVARILASTTIDMSSFTSQVSWWTGCISTIYPLFWGTTLYPKIKAYISGKILVVPKTKSGKNDKKSSKI